MATSILRGTTSVNNLQNDTNDTISGSGINSTDCREGGKNVAKICVKIIDVGLFLVSFVVIPIIYAVSSVSNAVNELMYKREKLISEIIGTLTSTPLKPPPPVKPITFDWVFPTLGAIVAIFILTHLAYAIFCSIKRFMAGRAEARKSDRGLKLPEIEKQRDNPTSHDILASKFTNSVDILNKACMSYVWQTDGSRKTTSVSDIISTSKLLEEKILQLGVTRKATEIMDTYSNRFQNLTSIIETLTWKHDKNSEKKLNRVCSQLCKKIACDIEEINGNGGISVRASILSLRTTTKTVNPPLNLKM